MQKRYVQVCPFERFSFVLIARDPGRSARIRPDTVLLSWGKNVQRDIPGHTFLFNLYNFLHFCVSTSSSTTKAQHNPPSICRTITTEASSSVPCLRFNALFRNAVTNETHLVCAGEHDPSRYRNSRDRYYCVANSMALPMAQARTT